MKLNKKKNFLLLVVLLVVFVFSLSGTSEGKKSRRSYKGIKYFSKDFKSSDLSILKGKAISSLDGSPVPNVVVRIGTTIVATDINGDFNFTRVQAGQYTIYYDAAGYESQKQENINVFLNTTINLPTVIMKSNYGEIRGKVFSQSTLQPIAGTVVRVNDTVIPTNLGGEFRFTAVSQGYYNIRYDAPGHIFQNQEMIYVSKDNTANVPDVILSPDGPAAIVLDISDNRLYLYYGSYMAKSYPVATGMKGWPTPIGTFAVKRKALNPTWYPPDWADVEKPVPAGPNNPLGTRILYLSKSGYGIHGTNKPSSIGKRVTHGCVRLFPKEIVDLYDRAPVGTVVKIVP
ncbi:MAG: L,D-transpeptidase family protein [Actinobacteria bacterium]|nr:L,D-transpeptidase family protein [Actinomycetota bacterium]